MYVYIYYIISHLDASKHTALAHRWSLSATCFKLFHRFISARLIDWLSWFPLMVWFCWKEFSSEHIPGYCTFANVWKQQNDSKEHFYAAMRLTSRLILRGQVSRRTAETGLMDMVNDDQWCMWMDKDCLLLDVFVWVARRRDRNPPMPAGKAHLWRKFTGRAQVWENAPTI